MSRYCSNCGAELPQDAGFCPNCGKSASQEAPPQERQTRQASTAGASTPSAHASATAAGGPGVTGLGGSYPSGPSAPDSPEVLVGPRRNNSKAFRWILGILALLVLGMFGLLVLGWFSLLFAASGAGLLSLLAGIVIAILPVPVYLALALWLDRYEREPAWMLAGAFVWGATVAVFLAILVELIWGAIVHAITGSAVANALSGAVSAGVVEEGAKGLALLILFFWKKDEFDGVVDGIVYAAMVGLGFAMVENFQYYGFAVATGAAQAGVAGGAVFGLVNFVVRGLVSPFVHPLFTSLTGIGLGLARQSTKTYVKFVAPVVGLLAAMTVHALWDVIAFLVSGSLLSLFLLVLFIEVPVTIGVLAVVFFGLRREGRIVGRYLEPELQSGVITQQEYHVLTSVRGRIGASFRALTGGGFGGWRARSRFNQAATELAFLRDRVHRGITSPEDPEREAAYLRLMRDLKAGMGGEHEQVVPAG